ncbi:hypothetical protein L7F22_026032 [Adiantum nelumboides]|nr:hypothetical protein [Adiantum nelumboides]
MLSGVALQFMKPFSIGDTIKAGPVQGQVLDIGLTSTQLLDLDKFPVAVPNSFFSSQVIVNKSHATWRAFTVKIPVQLNDYEKLPQITQEIKNMLKSHPCVTLQNKKMGDEGSALRRQSCYGDSRAEGERVEQRVLCEGGQQWWVADRSELAGGQQVFVTWAPWPDLLGGSTEAEMGDEGSALRRQSCYGDSRAGGGRVEQRVLCEGGQQWAEEGHRSGRRECECASEWTRVHMCWSLSSPPLGPADPALCPTSQPR